jgi:hypothetical protein
MLLLMVYWNPEDEKSRLERRLRRKREERAGIKQEDIVVQDVEAVEIGHTLKALEDQKRVSEEQTEQIRMLTAALAGQKELMEEIISHQKEQKNETGYQVIYKPADINKTEVEEGLPSLDDYNVNVIDTSGIEVGMGKAGETKSTGGSIKDKAARLKALRQKKKEK